MGSTSLLMSFFLLLVCSPTHAVVENLCASFPSGSQKLEQMKLPEAYKVSATFTDWMENTTSRVEEWVAKETRSIRVSDRLGADNKWILPIGSPAVYLNNTANTCAVVKDVHPFSLSPSVLSRLGSNGTSITNLMNDVITFSQKTPGAFLNSSQIMGGVESVHWLTCVNGTGNDTSIQLEVIFAGNGDDTIKPPSAAFDNPMMLFFRVAEFEDFQNSTEPVSAASFEMETYDVMQPEDRSNLEIPPAVTCDGWSTGKLPVVFAEPFSALLQMTDDKGVITTAKIFHSTKLLSSCVCVDGLKEGDVIPFFNEKSLADGANAFVHDFNTGYQYSLSSSRCENLSAIPVSSADVRSENDTVTLKSIEEMLVNVDLPWGKYGKTGGVKPMDIWRAVDPTTNGTIEVILDGSRLVEIRNYAKNASQPASSTLILPAPSPSIDGAMHRARECFAAQSSPDNTFTFNVKGKKLANVIESGEGEVTQSIALALAKVAPIHPLRVKTFYDERPDKSLGVFFTVADKNNHVPAATANFSYKDEVSTADLFSKLNETFSKGEWSFTVPAVGSKKEEVWSVLSSSLSHIPLPPPAPQPAPYEGYTGGSMFVLGLFSLILGCGIGAGGLFFITKRQRISTLAYQVFE